MKRGGAHSWGRGIPVSPAFPQTGLLPLLGVLLAFACSPGTSAAGDAPPLHPPEAAAVDSARLGRRTVVLPVIFYQPETKWGAGLGILHSYRSAPRSRLSALAAIFILTQRSQYSASGSIEHYTPGNLRRISAEGSWSRFPDFFYGIGNQTSTRNKESFTLENTRVSLDLRRLIGPGLYAGLTGSFQKTRPVKFESGGLLDSGRILGSDGGILAGAGAVLSLDRRDRGYGPRGGELASLLVRRFAPSLGSDFAATRIDLDARIYRSLAPRHVLALQVLGTSIDGEEPFYDLAGLGGASVLRGEYEGRYRGRHRVFGQAEYRFPLFFTRLGGVAFGGAGQVARTMRGYDGSGFHACYGTGLRFLVSPDEGIAIRADFGWSGKSSGVYFAFGDAF